MEKQIVKLDDDREVVLRLLRPGDKEKLLKMFVSMSEDALLWSNPPYDEQKIDRWMGSGENELKIVALSNNRIVGITAVYQDSRPRLIGIGGMMIYIHQEFHGVGLGKKMTEILLNLAKEKGIHRIGLEVVEDNEPAVKLYKKLGFEIEGIMRDAYFGADGRYHNLLVMSILFRDN